MFNEYLMQMSVEQGDRLYGLLGNLQLPAFAVVLLLASHKYPIPAKQKVALWATFAIARFWSAAICPLLYTVTDGMVPRINLGVAFLFFLMIVASIAYLLKMPVQLFTDVLIPVFILGRGLAILGCVFAGCCHGFPSSFGVYSRLAETVTFPTVFIDSLASFAIVAYLAILARKQGWSGDGRVTSIGLILFGVLRVVIDILRDNEKLVIFFTFEGLCGFIYIIAGIAFLFRLINIRMRLLNLRGE